MALSEIRVNTTKTRTGVGTITYTETGPVITGIATASNFKTGSTNVHSTGVELANINTGGSTATFGGPISGTTATLSGALSGTTASFSGTVSIGGTLTYEDVTNIDSVGVITARNGIYLDKFIYHSGDLNTSFGFPNDATDTFVVNTNSTEKLRITSGGQVNIGGDLTQTTYPFSVLGSTGGTGQINIVQRLKFSGNNDVYNTGTVIAFTNTSSNANAYSYIGARIDKSAAGDNANALIFATNDTNTAPTEKLRITSAGLVGIGTVTPSVRLHVSNGSIRASNTAGTNFTELGSDGNIEIKRTGGSAYIDFADATSNDADCRIQHVSDGLQFSTGGQGSRTTKLSIASGGEATFSAENININRNAGDPFLAFQTSGTSNAVIYGGASTGLRAFTKPSGGSLTARVKVYPSGKVTINPYNTFHDPTHQPTLTLSNESESNLYEGGKWSHAAIGINNSTHTASGGSKSQIVFGYLPRSGGYDFTYGSGYIGATSVSQSGAGKVDLVFGTKNVTSDTQPTERLRITCDGKIGIGRQAPSEILDVKGVDDDAIKFSASTYGGGHLRITGADETISGTTGPYAHTTRFKTKTQNSNSGNGAERDALILHHEAWSGLHVASFPDGQVAIRNSGTTSQSANLIVFGDADNSDVAIFSGGDWNRGLKISTAASGNNDALVIFDAQNADNGCFSFKTHGDERLRIDSGGNMRLGLDSVTTRTDSAHYGFNITGKSGTGAGSIFFIDSADNCDANIAADNGVLLITADYSDNTGDSAIKLRVDGSSEKMQITNDKGVLINHTSKTDISDVHGLKVGNVFRHQARAGASQNDRGFYSMQTGSGSYGSGYFHMKTDIATNSSAMFLITVRGYAYGQGKVVFCQTCGYCYSSSNNIINTQDKSWDGTTSVSTYKSSDSKLVIRFTPGGWSSYYMGFCVDIAQQNPAKSGLNHKVTASAMDSSSTYYA